MIKQTAKKKASKVGRPLKGDSPMDATVTIKVPGELRDAATEKSKRTGVSVAFVLRSRLEQWVADDE
jgi:LDH2 family malate/lactate/ureidoglycolate dehydrogenase